MNTGAATVARTRVQANVHASAVVVGEAGILIRGASGAGKSSLAFAILALGGMSQRFARLIGDDRIELTGSHGRLIARGHAATPGMLEQRGHGLITLAYEAAAVIKRVVDLLPLEACPRWPEPAESSVELCGAKLSRLALPIGRASYDCALIVIESLQQPETI